jgi:hypothetical protein
LRQAIRDMLVNWEWDITGSTDRHVAFLPALN